MTHIYRTELQVKLIKIGFTDVAVLNCFRVSAKLVEFSAYLKVELCYHDQQVRFCGDQLYEALVLLMQLMLKTKLVLFKTHSCFWLRNQSEVQ